MRRLHDEVEVRIAWTMVFCLVLCAAAMVLGVVDDTERTEERR